MNSTNGIDEDELDINQQLKDIYHSPAAGYTGVKDLYQRARDNDIPVSLKQVRNFLKSQDTYTKTFPKAGPGERKKIRPTIVGKLGQQLQMDLVDMTGQRVASNDGNRYIITSIEVLSRYAFTTFQKGKYGKDTVVSVRKILDEFEELFGDYPDLIQFDEGPEFLNPEVKKLLADLEINYFSTFVRRTGYHQALRKNKDGEKKMVWEPYTLFQRKASLVEKLNRTLKGIMLKYFLEKNTQEWIHILDDITHNYNMSANRSIKMKPNEVDVENAEQVWLTLYGENVSTMPKGPRYSVGDIARVEKYHPETRHTKGYTINFTEEEFKIIGVYRSNPIMYKIQDMGTD